MRCASEIRGNNDVSSRCAAVIFVGTPLLTTHLALFETLVPLNSLGKCSSVAPTRRDATELARCEYSKVRDDTREGARRFERERQEFFGAMAEKMRKRSKLN